MMSLGLIGKKCGMTRLFDEHGASLPVTVIAVEPNRVTQVKTLDRDGYTAIQVTAGDKKAHRVNKPLKGHYGQAGVGLGAGLWEFRLENTQETDWSVGAELTVDLFQAGQCVDVTGISKGKGFAGTIKRHNFAGQDVTHGNSLSHRVPGSIGQNQTPGRVFKGKKMAGHMGHARTTVQNLSVVRVDQERGLLWIKGGVPGAPRGTVIIKPTTRVGGST